MLVSPFGLHKKRFSLTGVNLHQNGREEVTGEPSVKSRDPPRLFLNFR